MFNKKCGCLIPAIISIILGIIVGFISFTVAIPGLIIAIWIAFGISIGALILVFLTAIQAQRREEWCVCKYGSCITMGAITTIIATIIGLSITILTGVLATAILIGLGTLFLAFTIFSVFEFMMCLVKTNCKCRD